MKKIRLYITIAVFFTANSLSANVLAQNNFDKDKDILVCQFDNFPDSDDIYAQAALASFLAHPDQEGVNYLCVAGAWGTQVFNSSYDYDDTQELMNLGFGREIVRGDSESQIAASRWVSAHGEIIYGEVSNGVVTRSQERVENMDFASDIIVEKVKPILEAGGRVFVTEAGQSDITADWIEKLVDEGVNNTQSNVILVQHSAWNRRQTAGNVRIFDDGKDDWGYVTNGEVNTFITIDDGNSENGTPNFKDESTTFLQEAVGNDNPNSVTQEIWNVAQQLASESSYQTGGGVIRDGGVDFSDFVEVLWVFDLADEADGLHTVREYWDAYVLNEGTVTPVSPPPPQTGLGLVAHWALDEGAGESITDSSGNNNDGILVNGSWSTTGAQGGSVDFAGGNEGIEIPGSALDTVSSEITISLWVNGASTQPIADTIFTALDSSGNRVLNIHLPWSDSRVYWDAGNSGGSFDRTSADASASLYAGGWNHWAFTKSADTGVMNIYVNGSLFATGNGNTYDMAGIASVVLGGDESVAYSGGLDEVRLYDTVLSEAEIAGLYQGIANQEQGNLGVPMTAINYLEESDPDNDALVRDMATKVGYIKDGTWIRFDEFNFSSGASTIEFSASSNKSGGTIEARTGSPTGTLIASVDVTGTDGWFNFETFQSNLNTSVSGVEDLYLVFVGNSNTWLFDIESFEIN